MKQVKVIELVGMTVISIPSKIRKEIGLPIGTIFKIWRSDGKVKLESVKK